MADLAYDASDPASSEPAGIAQQQANRPPSSNKEQLRVFISYSRDDLKFADQQRRSTFAGSSVSSTVTTFPVARTGNDGSAT